jgi:hypothetical protein
MKLNTESRWPELVVPSGVASWLIHEPIVVVRNALPLRCAALRSLHLAGCFRLTAASVAALLPLPSLHTLTLQGCEGVTSHGVRSLAGAF